MAVESRQLLEPVSTPAPLVPAQRAWRRAWQQPGFRWQLILALALGVALAVGLPYYFARIQARIGLVLPDPVLARLPARDLSGLTFSVIYLSIVAALGDLLLRPWAFLRVLWAYCFLHLLRIGTLWLVPLDPPAGLVLLHDPIVDTFFYPTTAPITKDLFFSGHTATLLLLALAVRTRWLGTGLFAATALVGLLVMIQHAHYTYDVLAAPFFAWGSFWLARKVKW